ncbi:MAG: hypothetical protein AAB339_08465, partial [Elusimicrobiota bacterium]
MDNGFVYDDEVNIVSNPAIRSLTPLSKFFDPATASSDDKMNHGLWRPLTRLVWALDYRIGGLKPGVYHLTNVLLHALNALLVFWLAGLLFAPRPPPAACAGAPRPRGVRFALAAGLAP